MVGTKDSRKVVMDAVAAEVLGLSKAGNTATDDATRPTSPNVEDTDHSGMPRSTLDQQSNYSGHAHRNNNKDRLTPALESLGNEAKIIRKGKVKKKLKGKSAHAEKVSKDDGTDEVGETSIAALRRDIAAMSARLSVLLSESEVTPSLSGTSRPQFNKILCSQSGHDFSNATAETAGPGNIPDPVSVTTTMYSSQKGVENLTPSSTFDDERESYSTCAYGGSDPSPRTKASGGYAIGTCNCTDTSKRIRIKAIRLPVHIKPHLFISQARPIRRTRVMLSSGWE